MKKSLTKIFHLCRVKKKPILAFNIQNLQQLDALAIASKINNMNVIAQFSEKYFDNLIKNEIFSEIKKKYKNYKIYFFLDHCGNKKKILKAVKLKFDGVMYDGSNLKIDKNIRNTNQIYKEIKNKKILLEAEIGVIYGQKDYGIKSDNQKLKLIDLKKFISETKFHTLAIAAGNSHGLEKSDINLRLYKHAIKYNKKIKLVFHGASGVKINFLKRISKLNFVKINYSSILKKEMMRLILKYKNKDYLFDQMKFNEFIRDELIIFFSKMLRKYK
tara:strand:+ start:472 stop:1290 length:819 start_codon:yes stop_codon:yes gene_type:complete